MLDLAIIGSGPAAMSAAIYAARAGISVKVFEKKLFGGALTEIARIDNFPGFSGKGSELAEKMHSQAISAGAKIEYGEFQGFKDLDTKTESKKDHLKLIIDDEIVLARTALIATGSEPKKLNIETSTPVSYCATCDAPLYKDKEVLVIGGGNSAVQESIQMLKIVKKLTIVSRSPFCAEKPLVEKLRVHKNVKILENTSVTPEMLEKVDGVFAFIGKKPATNYLPKEILNQNNYIITDDCYMTPIEGIFAAGDVRSGSIKQAITAAAEGATAAIHLCNFLENH